MRILKFCVSARRTLMSMREERTCWKQAGRYACMGLFTFQNSECIIMMKFK
jgi:hypothetical protein